jgi:hypothetical protein
MTRTGRALVALLLAQYNVQCLHNIASTSFVEGDQRYFTLWDDAMISMQYARNLVLGNGLVWVAGEEPVQGFTNLGVTLLMAVLHLMPVPRFAVPLLFQLLNLVCLIAILLYVYRLTELLFESRWPAYAAAAVSALYGPLNIWSLQGSDSGVLALISLVALVDLVRARMAASRPPLRMYGVLAAGVVVRQDYSLVAGLLIAYEFVAAGGGGFRGRCQRIAPGVIFLAATWAVLLLFSQWYYGDPLPNTYYLKATGNPRDLMLRSGLSQLFGVFAGRGLVPLLLAAVYAALLVRSDRRDLLGLLLAIVGTLHAYYVWVGGDWVVIHTSRYLVPAMPLFIALLCGGAWWVSRALSGRGLSPALGAAVFGAQVAALAFCLNPPGSIDEWHLRSVEPMYRDKNQNNLHFGLSVCRYTTEETTVGVFWAGLPPYVCDRRYVDLLGRADRHIAKVRVTEFQGPGHAKWDWDYILNERKLDLLSSLTPELQPREDFRRNYCIARMPRPDIVVPVRKQASEQLLDADLRLCEVHPYPPCRDCRI